MTVPVQPRGSLLNRRSGAIIIFALWAGALGWMAQRYYLGQDTQAQRDNPRWPVPPGSSFLSVAIAGRQVGIAGLTVDTLVQGLRVLEITTLDLPRIAADTPNRTSQRIDALYTRGLRLQRFQSDLLSEHGRRTTRGAVDGDTLLTLISEASSGQPADTQTIALRRPIVLPGAIPLIAASRGLPRPGSRLNIEVYDPVDQEVRVERLAVTAESLFVVPDSAEFNPTLRRWEVAHSDTVRAWRLQWEQQGLPVHAWIDGVGMPVRTEYPFGAVLQRSAFELVRTNYRMKLPPLWDSSTAAPVYLPLSGPPPVRTRLAALGWRQPDKPLPLGATALHGGWQRQEGDTVYVGATPVDTVADSSAANNRPLWSPARPDSTIQAAAARIIGREQRPPMMAEALTAWVRTRIALRNGAEVRIAGSVLATAAGTAQERAVLLASLSEAAGLRSRTVWGLVLLHGRWVQRPWVEIWTGSWVPYDPASAGNDAGRVRLATAGISRFMSLVLRAGRLRLRVLEETP